MNYQGTITNCNFKLCQFQLDDLITVHFTDVLTSINKLKLPQLGEQVLITKGTLFNSKHIILNPYSDIICQNSRFDLPPNSIREILKYLNNLGLKAPDLLKICKFHEYLKIFTFDYCTKVTKSRDVTCENILLKILPHLVQQTENAVCTSILENCILKVPNGFKPDEKLVENETYLQWKYDVQSNESNEYLVGFLHVSKKLGFVVLSDPFYYVVCILVPGPSPVKQSKKLKQCLNRFVLVKKFHLFSETYKDFGSVQYLYTTLQHIYPLELVEKNDCLTEEGRKEAVISVLHRGSVSLKGPEVQCMVQCQLNNDSDFFLRLQEQQLSYYPIMNPGDVYTIQTANLQFLKELTNLKSETTYAVEGRRIPVFTLPKGAELQVQPLNPSQSFPPSTSTLLTIAEAASILNNWSQQKTGTLVSFHGVILQKRFVKPLPNPTSTTNNNRIFGTPGSQVHQLILVDSLSKSTSADYVSGVETTAENSEKMKEFDQGMVNKSEDNAGSEETKLRGATSVYVYLHNWHSLQHPLGLLPGMRVAVNRVLIQRGRYFKACFLTNIQPLHYEPLVPFQTCSELLKSSSWGPGFPLGAGEHVPTGCVSWGRSQMVRITHLTAHYACVKCGQRKEPQQLRCCNLDESFHLLLMVVLNVRDEAGVCDVITKDDNILRLLLGFTSAQWDHWHKAMAAINGFSLTQQSTDYICKNGNRFATAFRRYITSWNRKNLHSFDLKCRKLDKNAGDINDYSKWYCVEVRPV